MGAYPHGGGAEGGDTASPDRPAPQDAVFGPEGDESGERAAARSDGGSTVTEKVIICPRAEGLVEEVTLPIEVLA